ncbi:Gldg family protein [Hansschlegelia sp. KR7-227]|uniref:Gldg family protein n=1 Tax=Hansschlegelia sp. KR7-227 TaxID=3400914 RepID=UPI003C03875A
MSATAPAAPLAPPSWPRAVLAVFRHQLRLLIHSRLTLAFQLAFLIALPVAVFLVGDFFAADSASLDLMLGFLPWVALVFVPALAMKTFVGRALDREREFLMTLPLPPGAVALGAWLAGAVVLLATLAFTAPFAATVAWLGEPDYGAMAAGYLGAACLLLSFYAVGLFASAVAASEIGAFVVAVALLFLLLLFGWDGVGRLAPGGLAAGPLQVAAFVSPKFWMERIATGDVELKAVAYFALLSALALAGAGWGLASRAAPGPRRSLGFAAAGVVAAALAAGLVAVIPSRLALDLTDQRVFTLSPGTQQIVRSAPEGSRIELYWSASGADIPSAIRAYADRVADLLKLAAERSGGRLSFSAQDPEPDSAVERQALAAGVQRTPLSSGDAFILGAAFVSGERRTSIAYFDQRREGLLEYDVATALAGLARTRVPRIGVVSPLLAPGDRTATDTGFNAIGELRRAYDVAIIPAFADTLPEGLDALVVIGATFLKREMLYAIDQAVMRGMGLIVMIDPRLRLSPASDRATPQPSTEVDDISDLLLAYGVRYRGDGVVGDAGLATPVADATEKTVVFPFWMRFARGNVSASHAVTAGLGDLMFVEPGAFDVAPGAALVSTTDAAGALAPAEMAKTPATLAAAFRPGGGRRVVAAEVDGPFRSAYPAAPDGSPGRYVRESGTPAAVFAIADVDWILDPFAYEPAGEPGAVRKARNDNVALFLNMAERATGGGGLIAIRSRGQARRPLTRIAALARDLSQEDKDARGAAMARVAEVERRIAQLPAAAGVSGVADLPADVQARVMELRAALAPDRKILRAFQARDRAALETLRARTIAVNLAAGPALALGFAGLVAVARRRRQRRAAPAL